MTIPQGNGVVIDLQFVLEGPSCDLKLHVVLTGLFNVLFAHQCLQHQLVMKGQPSFAGFV